MLSAELSRSQFASETLHSSTQALKELSTRYSTFDDLLLKSRRLITDLVRKNKSDAWYYEKAIYIMVVTIVWLIVRRFLYGPIYLLVWLPLRLSWWVLSLFGTIIGAGGGFESAIAVKSGDVKVGVESITPGKPPKVEVKGIPEEIHTIPASLIHTEEIPIQPPAERKPPVDPKPPVERKAAVEREHLERKPIVEKPRVEKKPPVEQVIAKPPKAAPIEQTESVLEKVGESIERQRREENSRQYGARQGLREDLRHDQGQHVRHNEL